MATRLKGIFYNMSVGFTNYIYKFLIAIGLTPLLYLAHFLIDRFLGKELAEEMMESANADSNHSLF